MADGARRPESRLTLLILEVFHYTVIVISKLENRICVFIDASNIWEAQKAKGQFLDYEKLTQRIKIIFNGNEIKVFYYTAYPADGTRDYSIDGKHKFFAFLKKRLGFVVRKKELKRIKATDEHGQFIKEKGNMDVEMTIDMLHHIKDYDMAVLFTGDADFLAAVNYLKRNGKKVYIISSKNNVSEELRTGGDGYTDIRDLDGDIWGRPLQYRPKP